MNKLSRGKAISTSLKDTHITAYYIHGYKIFFSNDNLDNYVTNKFSKCYKRKIYNNLDLLHIFSSF